MVFKYVILLLATYGAQGVSRLSLRARRAVFVHLKTDLFIFE